MPLVFQWQTELLLTSIKAVLLCMQASKYIGACTQIILLIDFKGGAKYNSTTRGYSSDPNISAVTEYDALDELLQQYQSEPSSPSAVCIV